jgi:hypothetical protein
MKRVNTQAIVAKTSSTDNFMINPMKRTEDWKLPLFFLK